jgi:hypothetical protein
MKLKPTIPGIVSLILLLLLGACSDGADGGGGGVECVAPTVPALADIPDDPSLAPTDSDRSVVFEVDGDSIVGKHVADAESGAAALILWQELVLRIPTNQRLDLVELNVITTSDPAGFMSGTTQSPTGRYGYALSVTADYLDEDRDPCDPLIPRRGNYGWTLLHEYAHMRSVIDGTLDEFTSPETNGFGQYEQGDGSGYPADGSPDLTRDFVTSYAERSAADEDYAESFTTYVMLATLPDGDTGAARKVRWFEDHGFAELRRAMRVTEPDGSAAPIAPAPRAEFPFVIAPPSWIHGTWQGETDDGAAIEYTFSAGDIVITETPPGQPPKVTRYQHLRDDGQLATIDPFDNNESAYGYHVSVGRGVIDRTEYHYVDSATQFHSDIDGLGTITFTRVSQ